MNPHPLFDDDYDERHDAGRTAMERTNRSGGTNNIEGQHEDGNHGSGRGFDSNKTAGSFVSFFAPWEDSSWSKSKNGSEPLLPAGFDARAAAAAAKQRVEQANRPTVVAAADRHCLCPEKRTAKARSDMVSASDAAAARATDLSCASLTSALCAGPWDGNDNHRDSDNSPTEIHRLQGPHALTGSIHRIRNTKAEF